MKFLVIETSSEKSFVLLFCEGVFTHCDLPSKKQQDHLLPTIHSLLTTAQLTLNDLDFLAVGNGPGSFTGTRIGILTAKTLSFTKNLPIVSFCSLLAYTPQVLGPFLLLTNAKSHGVYVYDGKKASLQTIKNLHIPKNHSIFSPHPDQIPFETTLAILNIPFVISFLEEAFQKKNTVSYDCLKPLYLHSP